MSGRTEAAEVTFISVHHVVPLYGFLGSFEVLLYMDIARTLFFCLYAYCLCGFEGNIGYSTYRRIDRNQSELCSCSCSHCRRGHIWILFRRALYTSACLKRSKTFVEAYARCITENVTKRWLRQTLVVERGIAYKYKYNPLARVIVPKICVPVLSSRAQ